MYEQRKKSQADYFYIIDCDYFNICKYSCKKETDYCKPTHKMKIYDVQNENKHVNNAEYYRINANFNTINSNNYTFIGNIKGYHVI